MNSDILALQYKKTQGFMQNRPRRVTFSLHHRLYRSVNIAEDLKILDREKYHPAGPLESRVWGERLDQDELESYMTLVEENFWPMVFSNKWSQYSSIRVTEGALLDSLLLTYYTLVTGGKLLTYTTKLYRKNVCTKPRRKRQRNSEKETTPETIKITFTYFSRTAEELSKIVEGHQGVRITEDEIRQQNPSFVPNVLSDTMQINVPESLGTFPDWVKQSSNGDDCDIQSKIGDHLMPDNPPNSPTPQKNHVTLKYTHSETHRRYDHREKEDIQTAREYSHLPMVLRTRHNGLASRPMEGIAIIGQKLNQNYPPLPPSPPANGQIVLIRKRQRVIQQMSIPRIGRNRFNRQVHLPAINTNDEYNPTQTNSENIRHSLQLKLLESNHLHDVDTCKTACIPHQVQFINVVSPLPTPIGSSPVPAANSKFDTDKLRINSSLENIRPDFVRPPIRKASPRYSTQVEGAPSASGKNYVMQKYLQESNLHMDDSQSFKSSERSEFSSFQPSLRFSSDTSETPQSNLDFYRQRLPSNFADDCLEATGCFIVRKEHVTSSRLYKTVTSLTISKIPDGGFQRWKYTM